MKINFQITAGTFRGGMPQMLEHNDIRWITTEEIPQYEFCPADKEILEKLRGGSAA